MYMFSFLQKHKNGILGTLLFHLVLLNAFFLIRITSNQDLESGEILIEFEYNEINYEKEVNDIIQKEVILSENSNYTNYAYNLQKLKEAENNLYKNETDIDKISDKEYINNVLKDALGEEDYEKYINSIEGMDLNENKNENDIEKPDEKEINIIKDGPSTLVYMLEDRYGIDLPLPVYQCEEGGIVITIITVNRNGSVISVLLDDKYKNSNICLIEAALKAAKSSRFNSDKNAPETQTGEIIYTFIPQ